MIIISRLLKLYAAENDIDNDDEDELKPDRPFKKQPDVIVSDIDGYYLVKFLEQEFKKKDLGGIFTRRNGKKYNGGYIKSVKDGKKGVTEEFLAAVQEFYPNIYQDLENFEAQIRGEGNFTDNELGEQQERDTKNQQNQKYEQLKSDSTPAQTTFAKFLTAITGMNIAQLQDILTMDPNSTRPGNDGKKVIPKELVDAAKDAFGFTSDDFKNYKENPGSASNVNNTKINLLKRKYLMASRVTRLKRIAMK